MTTSLINDHYEENIYVDSIYKNFVQAQSQLASIEAIDFYLAKQLVGSLIKQDKLEQLELSRHEIELIYHAFMALSESIRKGHTCLPLTALAGVTWARSTDSDNVISHQGFTFPHYDVLSALFTKIADNEQEQQAFVFWQNCLYLRRYFNFEQELATFIKSKLANIQKLDLAKASFCIRQLFTEQDFNSKAKQQLDWQMISVANALNKKFTIVAGGPGTGKTYTVTKILAAIILLAEQQNKPQPRMALVAPTGKAAQRLSESINNAVKQFRRQIADAILDAIPNQAQTVHRLLGVIPQNIQFKHNQGNKLALDVLLIDEVSMVDLALFTRIFRALADNCQVILLGDADQLPSVLTGSVLNELAPRPHIGFSAENIDYLQALTQQKSLSSFKTKSTQTSDHLTFLLKSHRFDGEGGIGKLASMVIQGNSEQSWQLLKDNSHEQVNSLEQINSPEQSDSLEQLNSHEQSGSQIRLYKSHLNLWLAPLVKKYYLPIFSSTKVSDAFAQFSQFRVLCATRKGTAGVDYFNELITSLLISFGVNASSDGLYHGQPIMISENNYQVGLYNGDIGLIWRDPQGHLMAVFEDDNPKAATQPLIDNPLDAKSENTGYRWLMLSQLPQYQSVFAMTIHKTQGSEFSHVAMVLPQQSEHQLLSRELLYTGITRAKSFIRVVSTGNVWQQAVDQKVQRYANLAMCLRQSEL